MTRTIDLETATELIEASQAKAEEIGVPSVVTVANSDGNLIAQHRMDGAWLASVNISKNKAYTAAALQMPTHELAKPSEPGEPLYGLQTTDDGRIVIFGGGFPLRRDGEIVGTIGSSGGQVDEDMEVARAGIDAFEELSG
ncbi:DNA polymerase III subunit delta' [Halobacteriales archaeon QS_3_64_16]|nr:MAG: DNA polymerase III subunit delta' [Halobacteriales archaeon QS_3_64_16]